MSAPVEILLWLAIVVVSASIVLPVLGALAAWWFGGQERRRKQRRIKKARKGRLKCEYLGWEDDPTEEPNQFGRTLTRVRVTCARKSTHQVGDSYIKYMCEEHAKKERGRGVARPINRPQGPIKEKVIR